MKLTCVVEEVYYLTKEEKRRKLYEKHKETMLQRTKEKRKDPEFRARENEANKRYYWKHREERLEYARQYREKKKLEQLGLVQL